MMNRVIFSIIVPVYNVEKYLEECVQSVLRQNFSSLEIILVDDGSTDRSGEICDELGAKSDGITVIHQENAGLSAARNTGIRNSQGEYLVFLDSDDLLYKNSLSNLFSVIQKQGFPDFVISRRCTLKGHDIIPCQYYFQKEEMSYKDSCSIYQSLHKYPDCWLGVWIFSVRRAYCLENSLFFYDGILHEDEEWVPRLFFQTDRIGFNNEILYCNRVARAGSITATLNIKREFDKLKILDLLHDEFNKPKYADPIKTISNQRMQQIFFGVLCDAYYYKDDIRYNTLLKEISLHNDYIKGARRIIYKLAYKSLNIMGARITCHCLAVLNSLKKK